MAKLSFFGDALADSNALHSNKYNEEVQFCAFDVLALDGEDLRNLPLSMRKSNLERLLRGRPDGIFVNPFEQGAIGPGSVSRGLRHGPRGAGVKARRPTLPRRPIASLDQGQEPSASRFRPSKEILLMTVWIYVDRSKQVGLV